MNSLAFQSAEAAWLEPPEDHPVCGNCGGFDDLFFDYAVLEFFCCEDCQNEHTETELVTP